MDIEGFSPRIIRYEAVIEDAVQHIEPLLEQTLAGNLNPRWVALRLLDGDESLLAAIEKYDYPGITQELEVKLRHELKLSSV